MIPLPSLTSLDRVSLAVSSLDQSVEFYSSVLGLSLISMADSTVTMGVSCASQGSKARRGIKRPLLELVELPGGRRVRGVTGLYQVAFRVPTRLDLARVLLRLLGRCLAAGMHRPRHD